MKILYIVFLVMSAVFYPLYHDDLSFLLLVTLLIFPVFMGIILGVTVKKLKIKISGVPERVTRGEKLTIRVHVKNPTVIPVSSCVVNMLYRTDGDKRFHKYSMSVPVKARSSEVIVMNLTPEHCGTVECIIKHASVFDLIGLFSARIKLGTRLSCAVMPKELPFAPEEGLMSAESASGSCSGVRTDGEPPDVAEMRDYRDGDRMNRIHWKLSSRSENFIVKEFSGHRAAHILAVPDLAACKKADEADRVLDVYASLMRSAISCGITADVLLKDSEDGEIKLQRAENAAELDRLLYRQVSALEYGGEISLTAELTECYGSISAVQSAFSRIIIITPSEKKTALSALEQVSCGVETDVFNVGEKGAVEEDKHSDVIIYDIFSGEGLALPEGFAI